MADFVAPPKSMLLSAFYFYASSVTLEQERLNTGPRGIKVISKGDKGRAEGFSGIFGGRAWISVVDPGFVVRITIKN